MLKHQNSSDASLKFDNEKGTKPAPANGMSEAVS